MVSGYFYLSVELRKKDLPVLKISSCEDESEREKRGVNYGEEEQ